MSLRVGQRVRLIALPGGLQQLPKESRDVFSACLGEVFSVEEIEADGWLVLNVSRIAVPLFGGHRHVIMVEPCEVAPIE